MVSQPVVTELYERQVRGCRWARPERSPAPRPSGILGPIATVHETNGAQQ
jgi:hypothetical protein